MSKDVSVTLAMLEIWKPKSRTWNPNPLSSSLNLVLLSHSAVVKSQKEDPLGLAPCWPLEVSVTLTGASIVSLSDPSGGL